MIFSDQKVPHPSPGRVNLIPATTAQALNFRSLQVLTLQRRYRYVIVTNADLWFLTYHLTIRAIVVDIFLFLDLLDKKFKKSCHVEVLFAKHG